MPVDPVVPTVETALAELLPIAQQAECGCTHGFMSQRCARCYSIEQAHAALAASPSPDDEAERVFVITMNRLEDDPAASAAPLIETRLREALQSYDSLLAVAVHELVERGDKDFFFKERVSGFLTVAKDCRRRHRSALAAAAVTPDTEQT